MSDAAYFLPLDRPLPDPTGVHIEHVRPTAHTVSTWGDDLQHGAPPSALLVRALDRAFPRPGTRLSRIAIDLLGPVPLTDLEIRTRIDRPGRKIELVVAELWATTGDGTARAVARGTGWRMETVDLPEVARTGEPTLPALTDEHERYRSDVFGTDGYLGTLDWRIVTPTGRPGPAAAWLRSSVDLVEGETPTGLERLFSVADVANGVGSKLDPAHWLFLNTDLTVHLFRAPDHLDWTGVTAETSYGADGIGMTAGILHDAAGPLGRITQNVQIRRR